MIDSAARAERFEMPTANERWYVWEVAQKPVTAKILFAVIDRLEREAVERFRSLSSTGSEIGGVLLGHATPGQPHLVTVEDYIAVPCDYSRGPLYRLSEADMVRFRPALERQGGGDAIIPVGFFRSHTRKGLALDADDVTVMDALFTGALPHRTGHSAVCHQGQCRGYLHPGKRPGADRSELSRIPVPLHPAERRRTGSASSQGLTARADCSHRLAARNRPRDLCAAGARKGSGRCRAPATRRSGTRANPSTGSQKDRRSRSGPQGCRTRCQGGAGAQGCRTCGEA